ncbi:MAG: ATP-binding protein [Candidatus Aminicenantes bacterium]|nr:ATP-binding protein [Candidatus Aminicenantes bacterium]
MFKRPYWLGKILAAWEKRPIAWLAGVRRVGKTTLAKMIPDALYLNCDLPSDVGRLDDPEFFFRSIPGGTRVVLDEIHRLADPSRVLKIAADSFPSLRILATGSSTLAATKKFRDSLTGRKIEIRLPPVLWTESGAAFGIADLDRRLLHGGLPEFLLAKTKDGSLFTEWMDGFYARDIQELFAVRERTGFLNLFRLMLRQSGGLADYSALARECDISRPTVKSFLEALGTALSLAAVPPFHGGSRREIIKRPKVYGFDTGFVTHAQGRSGLRDEDRGLLWEHLVLDVLRDVAGPENVHFWRNKSGAEVDFVVRKGGDVWAVECKLSPQGFSPKGLAAFRDLHPGGKNFMVSPFPAEPHERQFGGLTVGITGLDGLAKRLAG